MDDHVSSIKEFAERIRQSYRRAIEDGRSDEAEQQRVRADKLFRAAERLDELTRLTKPISNVLGDLSDLPPELVKELNISKTDAVEDQVFTVINACGGKAELDEILVGIFRKYEIVHKRRFIQNKLYKMIKAEMIWSVEGRKGVYTTSRPSSKNSARLPPGFKGDEYGSDESDLEEIDVDNNEGEEFGGYSFESYAPDLDIPG